MMGNMLTYFKAVDHTQAELKLNNWLCAKPFKFLQSHNYDTWTCANLHPAACSVEIAI